MEKIQNNNNKLVYISQTGGGTKKPDTIFLETLQSIFLTYSQSQDFNKKKDDSTSPDWCDAPDDGGQHHHQQEV